MSKQFEKLPIALDCKYLKPWITPDFIKSRADIITFADRRLRSGRCPGGQSSLAGSGHLGSCIRKRCFA